MASLRVSAYRNGVVDENVQRSELRVGAFANGDVASLSGQMFAEPIFRAQLLRYPAANCALFSRTQSIPRLDPNQG